MTVTNAYEVYSFHIYVYDYLSIYLLSRTLMNNTNGRFIIFLVFEMNIQMVIILLVLLSLILYYIYI